MAASDRNDDGTSASWPRRLGWLLLIWTASVAALGLAAWALRVVMRAVGMAA